jgi:hypothetical protein
MRTKKDEKKKKKRQARRRPPRHSTHHLRKLGADRPLVRQPGKRPPRASPEVRAKAEELTKGLNSDLDKTEALYDFVAKNFRYVSLSLGVGRYQPHSASDVLHDQYGDCKDKHTLLASLLEAEGLHADSVLINSSRKLDPDVPSPSQFDHVITMLPMERTESTRMASRKSGWTRPAKSRRSACWPIQSAQQAGAGNSTRRAAVRGAAASGRNALRHAHARPRTLGDRRARSTRSASSKRTSTMSFAATKNSCCARCSAACRRPTGSASCRKHQLRAGRRHHQPQSQRSGRDREAFTMSYDMSRVNFLDWSKKKTQIILPLVQFSLPDADRCDTDPDAEPLKLGPKGRILVQDQAGTARQIHRSCALPFS